MLFLDPDEAALVKRVLFILLAVMTVVPFLLSRLIGFSVLQLPEALAVGTGITAKLACSGRYISGFTDQQNLEDIITYSPAVGLVTLRHTTPDTIETDIAGFAKAAARYYPGLGCTLQYPEMLDLGSLKAPVLPRGQGLWPEGEERGSVTPGLQQLLDAIIIEDNAAGLDTRALLVIHNGAIAAESYGQGINSDTPLLGWSMGKSVTAILLGRMQAMGIVDVSETGLFNAWQNDARSDISLLNLLQMTSGLDFEEPYIPGSDSTRMLFFAPSAAEVAMESELAQLPGTHFYYSSGTSNLLARLAWDRLGADSQALLDFFATELAKPLGLTGTIMELDASGVFVGSSYIYAPARDWARLGLLMLNDGKAGGYRLLPEGWSTIATAPNSSNNDPRYGYQFWLNTGGGAEPRWPDLEPGAYAMMGNRGQVVMMLPESDAVVVRLGWTGEGDYPHNQRIARIERALD